MAVQQHHLALLHTFEVAAHYLNFTRAAEILCVSQGAVSQRIGQLEGQLGFRLFIRQTRRISLTDEGQRLLATLSSSLRMINEEIEDIRDRELRGTLHLGLAPTFASLWLMPRLPDFHRRWPGLNINIRVRSGSVDFYLENIDMALYYSRDLNSDYQYEKISGEYLLPVCSPAYLNRLEKMNGYDDAVFIHATESTDSQDIYAEWRHWANESHFPLPENHRFLSFNNFQMAIDSARFSSGIAMGRKLMIQRFLDSGELINPFGGEVGSQHSYYLIYPKENTQRQKFRAFREWFRLQLAEDVNFRL